MTRHAVQNLLCAGLPCFPVEKTLPRRDETQFHEKVRAQSVSVLTRFWLTEAHVKNDSAGAGANEPVFREELTVTGQFFAKEYSGNLGRGRSQASFVWRGR